MKLYLLLSTSILALATTTACSSTSSTSGSAAQTQKVGDPCGGCGGAGSCWGTGTKDCGSLICQATAVDGGVSFDAGTCVACKTELDCGPSASGYHCDLVSGLCSYAMPK